MMKWKQIAFFGLLMAGMVFLAGCTTVASPTAPQEPASLTPTNIQETTLAIDDMTCPSCALGVEYQLKQVPGVIDAKISYKEGQGVVTYDADTVSPEAIAKASDVYPARVVS